MSEQEKENLYYIQGSKPLSNQCEYKWIGQKMLDDCYTTGCGKSFRCENGKIKYHKFCQYCGKLIREI